MIITAKLVKTAEKYKIKPVYFLSCCAVVVMMVGAMGIAPRREIEKDTARGEKMKQIVLYSLRFVLPL